MSRTSAEAAERVKRLKQGNEVMAEKWKMKPSSLTAMYHCVIPEEDSMNVCSICLCLEDEPHNYGEEITVTAYDGDCDECYGESLPYAIMDSGEFFTTGNNGQYSGE